MGGRRKEEGEKREEEGERASACSFVGKDFVHYYCTAIASFSAIHHCAIGWSRRDTESGACPAGEDHTSRYGPTIHNVHSNCYRDSSTILMMTMPAVVVFAFRKMSASTIIGNPFVFRAKFKVGGKKEGLLTHTL